MIRTFRRFYSVLTPAARKSALVLMVLMLMGTILETLGIGLLVPVVALLLQDDPGRGHARLAALLAVFGPHTHTQLIVGAMLVLLGIWLVKAVFLASLTWRQNTFALDVSAELSHRLFGIYLRQPYTFHLQRNSAHLIHNALVEVGNVITFGINPAMLLSGECFVVAGIFCLLLSVEPLGAIAVILLLAATAGAFHRVTRAAISRWGRAHQDHERRRIQRLQEGLGGVKEVKLLGRDADFLAQYRRNTMVSARLGQRYLTLNQVPRLWLEFLAAAGLVTLVLIMTLRGQDATAIVTTLALFGAAAFRLMPSANRILGAAQSLRYGVAGFEALHADLMLATPEPASGERVALELRSEILLSNVTFRYENAKSVALDNVSVRVAKGEMIGFVGASGAGKSTLADVILGLLSPASGAVLVDGADIQSRMRGWQDQIGYVPQSVFLTDDTLRRNVAFGLVDEQIDDAAVARALHAAQLDEFVRALPRGVETMVGERGTRLSGGERQRIGIARALYHDPSVLVLDEATSALDTDTERGVMEAVTALHGQKTIVIIAHRLTTIERCDRLYRLKHGRVVEEGTPTSILRQRSAS